MQVIGATEVNETNPSIHINRCMISSNSRVLKALTAKQLGFNCQRVKTTLGCHLGVRNVRDCSWHSNEEDGHWHLVGQ